MSLNSLQCHNHSFTSRRLWQKSAFEKERKWKHGEGVNVSEAETSRRIRLTQVDTVQIRLEIMGCRPLLPPLCLLSSLAAQFCILLHQPRIDENQRRIWSHCFSFMFVPFVPVAPPLPHPHQPPHPPTPPPSLSLSLRCLSKGR